jgi:hypothetical protein
MPVRRFGNRLDGTADLFIAPPGFAASAVAFATRVAVDGSGATGTIPTAGQIGLIAFDDRQRSKENSDLGRRIS